MTKSLKSIVWYVIAIVVLGSAIRYFFLNTSSEPGQQYPTSALFAATLPNEKNEQTPLKQYQGKTVILNFWATWCEPCREEMPELSALHLELASKNGMVLGIAIDDVPTINEFAKEIKVSYPLLSAEVEGMDIASALGNSKGVLPYTVIIQPDGTVHDVFFGRISKALIEKSLQSIPAV
jgi:peroxiredoxin